MGTQAHWFSSPWRVRVWYAGRFDTRYTDTLADCIEDAAGEPAVIERRVGRKGDYRYEVHSVINNEPCGHQTLREPAWDGVLSETGATVGIVLSCATCDHEWVVKVPWPAAATPIPLGADGLLVMTDA